MLTNVVSRVRQAIPPGGQLLLFGMAVTLLGCVGAIIRPSTDGTSLWWPAAGLAVVGLLVARREQRRWVVGVLVPAGTVSHVFGGRPVLAAALLALVNLVGACGVVVALSWRRAEPRALNDLPDLVRVLLAVLLGALMAGATAGAVAFGVLGTAFLSTSAGVAASHASAVMLVMPLLLRTPAASAEATRVELAAQWLATALVTTLVFAPTQRLPLTFLLLPVLLWPALRSSVPATAVHLLTVGLLGGIWSLRGGGPFAQIAGSAVGSGRQTIVLLQVLVVTSSAVTLVVLVTVAQRRALLLATARREELFRVGFTESLLGLLLLRVGQDGMRIVELNGVANRLLNGHGRELVGAIWTDLFEPADRERIADGVATMESGDAMGWHGEVRLRSHSHDRWIEVSISPAVEGTATGDLVTVQMVDVTARRDAEARLGDLALRDGLTGLANRVLLDDRLQQALAECGRTGKAVGVMFLDVDGFKTINDTYGHATGDRVLIELGNRLAAAVRDMDTVARFGGDEFVVVCPNLPDREALDRLCRHVADAISAPLTIAGSTRRLGASIGMTLGHTGSDARELLRRADAAMYTQKDAARRSALDVVLR